MTDVTVTNVKIVNPIILISLVKLVSFKFKKQLKTERWLQSDCSYSSVDFLQKLVKENKKTFGIKILFLLVLQ